MAIIDLKWPKIPMRFTFIFTPFPLQSAATMKKNKSSTPDPWAETRPSQAVRLELESKPKRRMPCGCLTVMIIFILVMAYFFFPSNRTILVLGIDRSFENTAIGRSDTNILLSLQPLQGETTALSIPRDLWVNIPEFGENRINAAHFFGEDQQAGYGPELAIITVEENFGIQVDDYIRIQLEKFPGIVDAMGGVELQLDAPMGGYPAGSHVLNGTQALAFVRDRSGTDDFFRMAQGQVFLNAFIRTLLKPSNLQQAPAIISAGVQAIDTNIPAWQIPRVAVTALRAFLFDKINFVTVQREMVVPWLTPAGAQVLLPDWPKIRPMVHEEFGQ